MWLWVLRFARSVIILVLPLKFSSYRLYEARGRSTEHPDSPRDATDTSSVAAGTVSKTATTPVAVLCLGIITVGAIGNVEGQ